MKKFLLAMVMVLLMALPSFGASLNVTFGWQQDLTIVDPVSGLPVSVTGWRLYQSLTPGGSYTVVAPIPFVSPQTEYTSTLPITVPDGLKTTLYFVLTAYNGAGESGYSNEASGTFDLTAKPPGVPTNFKLTIPVQGGVGKR